MADDIVTQLQRLSTTLGRGEGRSTVLGAAAEIKRLRIRCNFVDDENDEMHNDLMRLLREIERLRAAGDEVSRVLAETSCECPVKCRCGRDSAIHTWQEARRG